MSRTLSLAFLTGAWLLGAAAAAATEAAPWAAVAAFGLLGVLAMALRPGALTLALVLVSSAAILGATWRYESTTPSQASDTIAGLNHTRKDSRFRAVVDDEPQDQGRSRRYRLEVREVLDGKRWHPASGRVLLSAQPWTDWKYGDLLEVTGKLETPPVLDDFDYRDYLLRRGIVSTISHPKVTILSHDNGSAWRAHLIDARAKLSDALARVLPEPEASLAGGILFGARNAIPRDLRDDMNATGTSHLVAVSGQNVTMLAALVIAVLGWALGRRNACWAALAGIIAYAALVGAQPSVIRAAVMGAVYVMSIALGRQNTAAVALLIAGAAMTALDPQVVHEVSFQLSFASVLGLIVLTPVLNNWLDRTIGPTPARGGIPGARVAHDVLSITLASIAFTLPITAINFQQVSVAAPLANLLAVPAFVAVAVTSGITALVALVLPGDANWLSFVAWPPAAYMIAVIRLSARLPGASLSVSGIHTWHAAVYYALLVALIHHASRRRVDVPAPAAAPRPGPAQRLLPAASVALALALASVAVWAWALSPARAELSVTFLDVGQGDAALIEGPSGQRVLVDGGPSGEVLSDALGRVLPFYDRRIDLVVLTHPQADHLAGLPVVLDRYSVGAVMTTRFANETALYDEWQDLLATSHIPSVTATRGQWIDLADGARLTVLNPTPTTKLIDDSGLNDTSIVLRLTMGDAAVLLTADISQDAESALIRLGTDLRSTVLKVPHHGSATSSSPPFLARVHPLVDVISVGPNNPYGHPAPEVLDRLQGGAVYRTDEDGDVTVSTDGTHLWVETQR